MTAVVLFLAVIGAIVFWWLARQGLATKPWLEQGVIGDDRGAAASPASTARLGLGVFLAVVGSLFALLISAYVMRMSLAGISPADAKPLPAPKLLWVNTALLAASSAALEWARTAARRGQMDAVAAGLAAAGVAAAAFLFGQLMAWQQLNRAGYFLASNPASSFFYLITGLHGLHLMGGLAALARTSGRLWRGVGLERLGTSIGLCATYWHFLLALWLVLFAVLTRGAGDLVAICRGFFI